jgi:hypothetical protein
MRWMFIVAALALVCGGSDLFAQVGRTRRPSTNTRPTFSPYLYLSRGSVGGVPAYQAWVQPRLEYQQRVNQVNRELDYLEQQAATPNLGPSGIGKPSSAATYMNYSHFYPQAQAPGRR